ncbi:MAG: sugar ABC transporter permease [Solirubrobacteraceae bacterium]|jgi:multiple sugar transport system permease protein
MSSRTTQGGEAGSSLPKAPAAGRLARRRGPFSRLSGAHKQQLAGWLFLTPAIAYVLFAFATPIVYNIALSFERDSLSTIGSIGAPWAGLSNYTTMFHDQIATSAIVHTLLFTVGSLAGQFIIGLSLALLFSNRFPGRTVARSLVIVPWLVPLIVTGVIFRFMFQQEGGAANQVLMDIGLIHSPIDWLGTTSYALLTVTLANIWLGVPFFTLLLYSALQEVPEEVKEAAMIDGANSWQRLRLVTIPMILPVIEITFILGFVFTVKVFDLVIGMTGGGPANATQLISTWSYTLGFQEFNFGEAAALNNVLLVAALVCAPLYLLLSRDQLRRSSGVGR